MSLIITLTGILALKAVKITFERSNSIALTEGGGSITTNDDKREQRKQPDP
jgi:hypothetical protein